MDEIPYEITMMKNEEILYSRNPKEANGGLILTNQRIIKFITKTSLLSGSKSVKKLTNYSWSDLKSASIDEGMFASSIHLDMGGFEEIDYLNIPKSEAKKIYAIVREIQDATIRRVQESTIKNESSHAQNPVQNLEYLKDMLDKKLITRAEYDAKKADLLSRM